MPFHIDYSGQAPISNYLCIEAANATVGAPSIQELTVAPAPEDNTPRVDATETASQPKKADDTPADAIPEEQSSETSPWIPTVAKRVTDATTRFISSFRGRTIQGLKVDLPEGYGGLVLRADAVGGTKTEKPVSKFTAKAMGKQKAANAPTRRATRSAARAEADADDVEVNSEAMDVDVNDDMVNLEEEDVQRTVRTLVPSSQFSSFILWHPDNPVDETRDEYFRSLKEWTRLAHEIHKSEI